MIATRVLLAPLALAAGLLVVGCERPAADAARAAPRAEPRAERPTIPEPRPQPGEFERFVEPERDPVELQLTSVRVEETPEIDGDPGDNVWSRARTITTFDYSSQRAIVLRSVHTDRELFLLASYRDDAPSETHKTWQWDETEAVYKQMLDREDMLVLKWSLTGNDAHLAFRDAEPHRADVWFWKAHRTNPTGFADDKLQLLSVEPSRRAKPVSSPRFGELYLQRLGDAGRPAYEERFFFESRGRFAAKYYPQIPEGSRGDIRAKGVWSQGHWTIELARLFDTGHDDDVRFEPGGSYLFAAACYEMAAGKVQSEFHQPLYRTGDAYDRLILRIPE